MLLLYWILQEGTDVEAVLWACGPNWDIMKEGSGEGAREDDAGPQASYTNIDRDNPIWEPHLMYEND